MQHHSLQHESIILRQILLRDTLVSIILLKESRLTLTMMSTWWPSSRIYLGKELLDYEQNHQLYVYWVDESMMLYDVTFADIKSQTILQKVNLDLQSDCE